MQLMCIYSAFLKWWYPQIIQSQTILVFKPMVLGDPPFEETPYVLDVHSVPGSYGSQPESAITVGQYT